MGPVIHPHSPDTDLHQGRTQLLDLVDRAVWGKEGEGGGKVVRMRKMNAVMMVLRRGERLPVPQGPFKPRANIRAGSIRGEDGHFCMGDLIIMRMIGG